VSRDPRDFYPTPPGCLSAFIHANPAQFPYGTTFHDPACGRGDLVKVLRQRGYACSGADLYSYADLSRVPHQSLTWGADFLSARPQASGAEVLVTNPPFTHVLDFARKAVGEYPVVVLLVRNSFLGGSKARTPFWHAFPCTSIQTLWPRPSFTDGARTDNSEYSWVVWDSEPLAPWPAHRILDWSAWRAKS